jgi:hypothetical protein
MKRILLNWDSGCGSGQSPTWTTPPVPPSQIPPWKRPLLTPQIQTVTGNATLSINYPYTQLIQATPPTSPATGYVVTLPGGAYVGQTLVIFIPGTSISTTANFILLGTFAGGNASYRFNNAAYMAVLQWDGTSFQLIGGNAQPSNATS